MTAIVKYMTGLSTLGAPELVSGYWHKMVLCSHLEYPADMYLCAYLKLEFTSEYKALVRIDPELTKNGVRQGPSAVPFLLPVDKVSTLKKRVCVLSPALGHL